MNNKKNINIYTFGDSLDLRTWSNIPYFLTISIEKNGYIVRRINIEPTHVLRKIWDKLISRVLSKIFKNNIYWYDRTLFCYIETYIKIWFYNKKFPQTDLNLFIGYSFYNPFSSKPNVLFSDWDYETMIKEKRNRKPYFFEKYSIKRQERVIKNVDLVISLFEKSAADMRVRYKKSNILFLGNNVINNNYNGQITKSEILKLKSTSNKILFIGTIKYIEGAKLLISSYCELKKIYPLLELTIIGIDKSFLSHELVNGITCYEYLNKAFDKDNTIYYNELISAKMVINPTSLWAGYSSIIEAMFFYTPVVVSPFDDFVNEFGDDIHFGKYCVNFDKSSLTQSIIEIIEEPEYKQMCVMAHNKVKDYTWDNYIENFLIEIQKLEK